MNELRLLLLFTMLFNFVHSFKIKQTNTHKRAIKQTFIKSTTNDFNTDLNIVHKFRGFFDKDSYNDVINDILNKKISKIFVDTNYKQLVSINKGEVK